MPTGYTSDLYDGKNISFSEFALQCAHAFLPAMRDASKNAQIPEEFCPSSYYVRQLQTKREELKAALGWTKDEADAFALEEFVEGRERARLYREKNERLRVRYEKMLDKVCTWKPPTEEHIGLRKFMIEQLMGSIKFDTGYTWPDPVRQSGEQYRTRRIESLKREIRHLEEDDRKERERAEQSTKWIRALRESLEATHA